MNIEKFIEIEEKYDLYNKRIMGCPYWLLRRFQIWNYNICKDSFNLSNPTNNIKISYLTYINYFLKSIISYFRSKRNIDILFLNHERRIIDKNKYVCAYTEKLNEIFNNTATIESNFEGKHFKPVATPNLIYSDYIDLFSHIFRKLNHNKFNKIKEQIIKELSYPIRELSNTYNWKPDDKLYNLLTSTVLSYKIQKSLLKRLIKRLSPKIIIEVVYYKPQNMIINSIAKEQGIKTIELQHGTMYNDHAAYHFSPKVCNIAEFPDEMFLFSDFWKRNITVPIGSEHLHSIGFPLFDEKIEQYKKINKTIEERKIILFISQGTIGLQLSHLAVELSKNIDKKKFKIIYKLHPSEYNDWEEKYPNLKNSSIEVIDKRDSIYDYFAKSDYLVGVYSTALFEGIGFGLKTFIYKVGHYEVMSDLVKDGFAKYINSAEELLNKLNQPSSNQVITDLWKENAFNNMVSKINKITLG